LPCGSVFSPLNGKCSDFLSAILLSVFCYCPRSLVSFVSLVVREHSLFCSATFHCAVFLSSAWYSCSPARGSCWLQEGSVSLRPFPPIGGRLFPAVFPPPIPLVLVSRLFFGFEICFPSKVARRFNLMKPWLVRRALALCTGDDPVRVVNEMVDRFACALLCITSFGSPFRTVYTLFFSGERLETSRGSFCSFLFVGQRCRVLALPMFLPPFPSLLPHRVIILVELQVFFSYYCSTLYRRRGTCRLTYNEHPTLLAFGRAEPRSL